jgi:type I restriction enzyme S subunit
MVKAKDNHGGRLGFGAGRFVGNLAIAGRDMTFDQSCYGVRGSGQTFDAIQHTVPRPVVLAASEGVARDWSDAIRSNVENPQTLAQLRGTLLPTLIAANLRGADTARFVEVRSL